MSNKFIFLLSFALLACNPFMLSSCGDDNEESSSTIVEDDNKAKLFIGEWYSGEAGGGTWIFYEDGKCFHKSPMGFESTGYWSYDSETKILATTVDSWNFSISVISDKFWTGTHLAGSGKTYTFGRVEK